MSDNLCQKRTWGAYHILMEDYSFQRVRCQGLPRMSDVFPPNAMGKSYQNLIEGFQRSTSKYSLTEAEEYLQRLRRGHFQTVPRVHVY